MAKRTKKNYNKNKNKKNNNQKRVSNFHGRGKKKEYAKVNGGVFVYSKPLSVGDLSKAINVPATEIIKYLFMEGTAVTINQMLDDDTIGVICLQFGYDFRKEKEVDAVNFEELEINDNPEDLKPRSPVVTVMGHVDHGKTTLIDAIRNSTVTSTEAGGITQAIGAYQKELDGKKITFIDTPGHAAFTHMRARGAQVTDLVILVVAADDGVMPQTIEAIDHAKAANCKIIVAINKCDKPGINIDRVKQELMQHEIISEDYGGDTIMVPISAKKSENIDGLLDAIILTAEMMELKANPNRYAIGTVLEANLDKGEGPKATLLVQNGTLKEGDFIVVGEHFGKVRRATNEYGKILKSAGPSTPVSVIGLSDVPNAGDRFMAFPSEKEAKAIADERALAQREKELAGTAAMSLADLNNLVNQGNIQEINVIVKADTEGSAEAVKASLEKLSNDQVSIKVLASNAGAINDSDVLLASASNAIIYGFNIRPTSRVAEKAKEEGVEIRPYRIIYQMIDDIEAALKGMYKAELVEEVTGQAEARHIYKITHVGTVAGSYITDGFILNNSKCRLLRDGVVIYEGEIGSLQRYDSAVKEVRTGYECGITIKGYNDIKEGDVIEGYRMIEKE